MLRQKLNSPSPPTPTLHHRTYSNPGGASRILMYQAFLLASPPPSSSPPFFFFLFDMVARLADGCFCSTILILSGHSQQRCRVLRRAPEFMDNLETALIRLGMSKLCRRVYYF